MAEIATNLTETDFPAVDIKTNFVNTAIPLSIALGLLCSVGIFGNIFILYVYTKKYPVCNFRYFVITIGIIDLSRALLTIPAEIYTQYTWLIGPISWICKMKIFFNTVSITYSTCILLLIGIDRFRKACRPHGWQMRPELALKLSIALGTLAVAWSVPALIFCGPQTFMMNHDDSSLKVTICLKDGSYINTLWPFLLLNILYAGPTCIAMIVTLVLYALIARAIFKRTKKRRGVKTISTPIRTEMENEGSLDESVDGISDTGNEASIDGAGAATDTNSTSRSEIELSKSEGACTLISRLTSNDRSYVNVNAGSTPTMSNDRSYINAGSTPTTSNDRGYVNAGSTPTTANDRGNVNVSAGPTPTTSNERGYVNVKIVSSKPTFLFNFPLIDVKALKDRPLNQESYTFKKPLSNLYSRASRRRQRRRMRRNTLIMFTLTLCFVVSILVYFILAIQLSDTEEFFKGLTLWQAVLVMFFLRLYYFNILINIVVYGLLDPRFRRVLRKARRRMSVSVASIKAIKNVDIRRQRRRR